MERFLVKDLMVPISEYATVTIGTTLLDALLVLERAQEAYTVSKYHHRAIIVLDSEGGVVGKISQLRALKAIQPELEFSEESSLDTAIHRLVAGAHMSLLVTRGERIVGVLRISDVFAAVFHGMMAAAG